MLFGFNDFIQFLIALLQNVHLVLVFLDIAERLVLLLLQLSDFLVQALHLAVQLQILGLQGVQLFLLLVYNVGILVLELNVVSLFFLEQFLDFENFLARIIRIFIHGLFELIVLFNMRVELFR